MMELGQNGRLPRLLELDSSPSRFPANECSVQDDLRTISSLLHETASFRPQAD
jgi:hypothetical protein